MSFAQKTNSPFAEEEPYLVAVQSPFEPAAELVVELAAGPAAGPVVELPPTCFAEDVAAVVAVARQQKASWAKEMTRKPFAYPQTLFPGVKNVHWCVQMPLEDLA